MIPPRETARSPGTLMLTGDIKWKKSLGWCDWETNCGNSAADAFCNSMGYEAAKTFAEQVDIRETMTIGDKRGVR